MTLSVVHVTTVPETLRFLSGHIAQAREMGCDVHVMSSPGQALWDYAREMQVEVHPIAMSRRMTPLADMRGLMQMRRAIGGLRPTIVHGHTPKGGLLAMIGAALCRVPIRIYHLHGLPLMTSTGARRIILRHTERTACALAHQVLCVSRSLLHTAIAEELCPVEKIKVLRHGTIDGVDAEVIFNPARVPPEAAKRVRDDYGIPQGALVVGFVGRVVQDKGLIELVSAWCRLREECRSLHLLVAGPFEDQDPVPANVESILRTDPRIHLAGMVRDMPSMYRAMDLLLLPTYREGFPTVLLEAAAMGVPVVASRVSGCVDAVEDGATGTLVPVRDVDALVAATRMYLNSSDLRVRHGRDGRARVLRDFKPQVVRQALFEEYRRLLAERTTSSVLRAGRDAGTEPGL